MHPSPACRMPNVTVLDFAGKSPHFGADVFLASGAQLIGDLTLGAGSSVWFNTVLRADVNHIRIGERTNIQDNTTVHVTSGGAPTLIGDDVTIGHNAIIHACTLGSRCLIGMGAMILDEAVIPEDSLVGAGALVTQGKTFPPRSLIHGSPAKAVRELTALEVAGLLRSAQHYRALAARYAAAATSHSPL